MKVEWGVRDGILGDHSHLIIKVDDKVIGYMQLTQVGDTLRIHAFPSITNDEKDVEDWHLFNFSSSDIKAIKLL